MKILVEFRRSQPSIPARVRLLREAPSSVQIEMALRDGIRKGAGTNTGAIAYGYPDEFTKAALPHIIKAVGNAKEFRFLGAGAVGLAFTLGDKVLKLEVDEDAPYSSKYKLGAGGDLQRKGEAVGADIPMVYDKGSFEFSGETFSWYVVEKFETIDNDSVVDRKVQNGVQWIVSRLSALAEAVTYDDDEEGAATLDEKTLRTKTQYIRGRYENVARGHPTTYAPLSEIESSLRLGTDWMVKLAKAMIRRASAGIPGDFHVGNLGIRRSGGEGFVVFFD